MVGWVEAQGADTHRENDGYRQRQPILHTNRSAASCGEL